MSDDDPSTDRSNDPLKDRSDDDPSTDRSDDEAVDQWVADVASEAERDRDDADPFERIGEGTGPRHGDPFDAFDEGDTDADGDDSGDVAHDNGAGDNAHGAGGVGDDRDAETATSESDERPNPAREGLPSGIADDDDPFTEFDDPTGDPFGEGETVFEHADAGEANDDGVWERMESTDAEAEAVPGKRYVDVNKHSYCETCEYFSGPPEIACSHEGTEILEFVDMDTVRVADCPVVAERKAIEDD